MTSFEHADKELIDIEYTLASLRDNMPNIARQLVAHTHDMSNLAERSFAENPDDPAEHSPRWHQYGILTHSEEFLRFMDEGVPSLVEQWDIAPQAHAKLSEDIDGVSKSDLLRVVSLLHDVGKFTARTLEHQKDGSIRARFSGHDAHSHDLIQHNLNGALKGMGLSEAHIAYIARCAGYHFELGKARNAAIQAGGYTLAFARSQAFSKVANTIISQTPDIALEIGLMFLADSFSKTEVAATAGSDKAIAAQRPALEQEIRARELNPQLINQALQQPVNLEIGHRYLQAWVKI